MIRRLVLVALMLGSVAPAFADDQGSLARIVSCRSPNAVIDIYVPEKAVHGRGLGNLSLATNANGYAGFDLTGSEKGKYLEPARVRLSGDGQFLIVDQYVRELPDARIPVKGGQVDFDDRSGANAVCGPVNAG